MQSESIKSPSPATLQPLSPRGQTPSTKPAVFEDGFDLKSKATDKPERSAQFRAAETAKTAAPAAPMRPETAKTERRAGILSGTVSALAGIGGLGAATAGYLLGAAWPLTVGALTLGVVGLSGYLALISWRSPAVVEQRTAPISASHKAA